jgi:hypothetical protein
MNYKKSVYVVPLLCLISLHVNAEEYKTGKLTQEEYQVYIDAQSEHTECMTETAYAQADIQDDMRVAADMAMKECAPILEDLYNYLVENNYSPEAMRRFVSSISNKSANGLLRNLMMYMASKKQE